MNITYINECENILKIIKHHENGNNNYYVQIYQKAIHLRAILIPFWKWLRLWNKLVNTG